MGVPVVPTAIEGTYEAWPRGGGKIRLHPVQVSFGDPLERPSEEETYEAFNDRLHQAVNELLQGG
jgi:1-acyl-sn-glycerol-3-phosphate acyltransferase